MFQIRLYNMLNLRTREMNFFITPSVNIEYFQEHTAVRAAWLFFMIAIVVKTRSQMEDAGDFDGTGE